MTDDPRSVRLGAYEYELKTGELTRDGATSRLRPQAARALALLVTRAGRMVSREELCVHLWPDTRVEYDLSLNVIIRQIRAALCDDAETPAYIETLPRRGYRLIAEVVPVMDDRVRVASNPRGPWLVGALVLVTIAVTLGFWPRPSPSTLAVLPFASIPPDDSMAYLDHGLAEELITALGGVAPERLRVIGRTSSFRLAGDGLDPVEIGARLNADYVLLGALRQTPSGYRATTQLLDVATTRYVWTAGYDLVGHDVGRVERRIAREVTTALATRLGQIDVSALVAADAPHPEARDAVLRARYLLSKVTRSDATRALDFVRTALRLDPGNRDALVALARAGLQLGKIDAAEDAIRRARMASPVPEGVDLVAGQIALYGRSDPHDAVVALERATADRPADAEARRILANALVAAGRPEEAIKHAAHALALDPVSSTVRGDVGWVFYFAGEFAEADRVCRSTLDLVPGSASAHTCVILSAALTGRIGDASQSVATVLQLLGASPDAVTPILEATRRHDSDPLWRWLLADTGGGSQLSLVDQSRVFALLGQHAEAARTIERAAALGAQTVLFVGADPVFSETIRLPRFQKALHEAGLVRNISAILDPTQRGSKASPGQNKKPGHQLTLVTRSS